MESASIIPRALALEIISSSDMAAGVFILDTVSIRAQMITPKPSPLI